MAATPILRFLLPGGRFPRNKYNVLLGIDRPLIETRTRLLQQLQLEVCERQRHAYYSSYRTMATAPTGPTRKPRSLEKPTKFNPPSHPSRIVDRAPPRNFPGPRMTQQQVEEQKYKKYPESMPQEGTFMFKFLSNPEIHMWICLSILFCFAFYAHMMDFRKNNPFAELMPEHKMLLTHPIAYIQQCSHVFDLSHKHTTAIALAKRKKGLDDVDKRRTFRKAHGTERAQQGILPWMGLAEEEVDDQVGKPDGEAAESGANAATDEATQMREYEEQMREYEEQMKEYEERMKQYEARKKRPVKRWFGIWE